MPQVKNSSSEYLNAFLSFEINIVALSLKSLQAVFINVISFGFLLFSSVSCIVFLICMPTFTTFLINVFLMTYACYSAAQLFCRGCRGFAKWPCRAFSAALLAWYIWEWMK